MPYVPTGRPPGRPRKHPLSRDDLSELTPLQWRGVFLEIYDSRYVYSFPLSAPVSLIAELLEVSRTSVYKWRSLEPYRHASTAGRIAARHPDVRQLLHEFEPWGRWLPEIWQEIDVRIARLRPSIESVIAAEASRRA